MSDSEVTMLSAQVPLYLRDNLHQLAEQHDRSVSAEIREALRTHVLLSRHSGGFTSSPPPVHLADALRGPEEEPPPAVEPQAHAGLEAT